MSFDLYFLPRPTGGPFDHTAAAERRRHTDTTSSSDLVIWDRIGHRLEIEMPTMESSPIDGGRSYADAEVGVELLLTPGEIALSAPHDLAGIAVGDVIDMLRRAAAIVETVTGLVAYDPVADASFLHEDVRPLDRFESVPEQLRTLAH